MLCGIFHAGSGIGNQLFRFVGTRIIANDRFEEHGMVAPELFKGSSFMTLPLTSAGLEYRILEQTGKVVIDDLKDVTIVDAEFQSETDFIRNIDEVRQWLKVEPLGMPDNLCVISHRGGEYTVFPDLYLPSAYWNRAIAMMRELRPSMVFEVQTDDVASARLQFPDFPIVHDVGHNWRSIRFANYLIVGNSSFSILPSLINEDVRKIIAPKFHAGHNKGYWQEPNNFYHQYFYI